MPPKTPQQMEEEFRRSQARQQRQQPMAPPAGVMPQGAKPPQPQQPASLATRPDEPPPAAAPAPVEQAKAGPTGFVGFGQYQAANVDAAERMAKAVGEQAMATGTAGLVGSEAGRQALLQRAFGSASELDAALAGASAPTYLQQLEAEYGPAAQQRREQQRREAVARSQQMQQAQAATDAKTQQAAQAEERRRAGTAGGELQRDFWANEATAGEISSEAARIRQDDANRPRGQMGAERWANLNGLTLEQWIRRGKQPAL
jgi:hypothetical protein